MGKILDADNTGDTIFTGIKMCKLAGVITDNTLVAFIHIIRFIVVHILSMVHFGLLIIFDYDKINLLTAVQSFHYILMHICGISMGLALVLKSKAFMTFCSIIENEFQHKEIKLLPQQIEVLKKINNFIKHFIKVATFLFVWGFSSTFLRRPLFDRTSHMTTPHEGWIPFEINDSWSKYLTVCAFQLLIATNLAVGHLATLITYVMHAKHLSGQCEILAVFIKDTFENVHEINGKPLVYGSFEREQFIKLRMIYIIKQHHILLRSYDVFQDMYSIMIFAVGLSCGLLVCTIIYTITDPNSTSALIAEFISLLVPEMIVIGCYCWFGQEVTDMWNELREVIYDIPWFMETISTQKSLLNMLTGSNREKIIMGCGIQEFSMKGYSELLQASFSCFNMLKAVR